MTPCEPQTLQYAETWPAAVQEQHVSVNRRTRVRFPVDLPFRYKTLNRTPVSGEGRVSNMGSNDLMVVCAHRCAPGWPVELAIDWPARLDDWYRLHLVVTGKVVRCEIGGFAVTFRRYRFQIARLTNRATEVEVPDGVSGAAPVQPDSRPDDRSPREPGKSDR